MGNPVVKVGPVSHVGIVVEDCEKAAEFYTRVFGIGPFDIVEFDMVNADYFLADGKAAKPKFKAALAYDGDFFIELVELIEGETTHTRFLKEKGEGFQHLCFRVTDTKGMLKKLKAEGIEPVLDYQMVIDQKGKKTRIHEVYLNTDKFVGGTTIQFLEYIAE